MLPVDEAVERVKKERRRRGWSIRTAAGEGGTSNQTWSTFEKSGVVTDAMQSAIVTAFGWPADWQDIEDEEPALNRLVGEVAGLRRDVRDLAELVRALHDAKDEAPTQRAASERQQKKLAR